MYPYWILFFIFAFGALQTRPVMAGAHSTNPYGPAIAGLQERRMPLFVAAMVFVALMIGLRYQVGGDWRNYMWMFEDMHDMSLTATFTYTDPGYGLLNWLVGVAGLRIWAVNLVCGGLFCFGLIRFAKCQPHPWLVVLVAVPYLIIGVAMGYTRQAVAIGFVMCSFAAITRGSFPKFVMWVLLAATFHRTAVILVPIIGFSYTRNRLQVLGLTIVGGLFGYYFLLKPGLDRLTYGYVENSYESQGAGIRLAMNVVPAAIFLMTSKRFHLSQVEHTIWRNLALVALVTFIAYFMTDSTVVVDRLALYVIPLQLFVLSRLPVVFGVNGLPSKLMLILVMSYCATVQFVWLNFANHSRFWIPYEVYPVFNGAPDTPEPRE